MHQFQIACPNRLDAGVPRLTDREAGAFAPRFA